MKDGTDLRVTPCSTHWGTYFAEVNNSDAALPRSCAKRRSNRTCRSFVPAMLRVPPVPAPIRAMAAWPAAITCGLQPWPR